MEKFSIQQTYALHECIQIASQRDVDVWVTGERNGARELVAEAIHHFSPRRRHPFIVIECNRLGENNLHIELTRPVNRNISGLIHSHPELLDNLKGCTVFLKYGAMISQETLSKLVTTLVERTKARIIFDGPAEAPAAGDADSNYLLIRLPILSHCEEDIVFFAHLFLKRANHDFDKNITGFSEEVIPLLLQYPWPGHLPELRQMIRQAVFLTPDGEQITTPVMPDELRIGQHANRANVLKEVTNQAEYDLIMQTLQQTRYNKKQAAQLLKISRKTLYSKLKKLSLPSST